MTLVVLTLPLVTMRLTFVDQGETSLKLLDGLLINLVHTHIHVPFSLACA